MFIYLNPHAIAQKYLSEQSSLKQVPAASCQLKEPFTALTARSSTTDIRHMT